MGKYGMYHVPIDLILFPNPAKDTTCDFLTNSLLEMRKSGDRCSLSFSPSAVSLIDRFSRHIELTGKKYTEQQKKRKFS